MEQYRTKDNKVFAFRLSDLLSKAVTVVLEDGSIYQGKFLGFDNHLNILLLVDEVRVVVRGTAISVIFEGNKPLKSRETVS